MTHRCSRCHHERECTQTYLPDGTPAWLCEPCRTSFSLEDDAALHPERDYSKMRQGELFKADGMRRAEANAPVSWRGWAELAVRHVAERRERFTTDPVWTVLAAWGVPKPPEERALGPLMKAADGWQWCEPTGEWHLSVRPECHRRPLAVYRSRLYAPVIQEA